MTFEFRLESIMFLIIKLFFVNFKVMLLRELKRLCWGMFYPLETLKMILFGPRKKDKRSTPGHVKKAQYNFHIMDK
jgi:hypothetical protein